MRWSDIFYSPEITCENNVISVVAVVIVIIIIIIKTQLASVKNNHQK